MSMQETLAAPARLTVRAMAGAARRAVFGDFRRFAKLAAVPLLLTATLNAVELPARLVAPGVDLVFMVADLFPFALLGVALTRAILLGEEPGFLPPQPLGRRTWLYVGYTLLMILAVSLAAVMAMIAGTATTFLHVGTAPIVACAVIASLGLLYVLTRLSFVFPAVSLDQRLGLSGSWRISRGYGLRLSGVLLAIMAATVVGGAVGSSILGGEFSISIGGTMEITPGTTVAQTLIDHAPFLVWNALVSLVGLGLVTGAYTYAFGQLSGWGAPRPEILERFE